MPRNFNTPQNQSTVPKSTGVSKKYRSMSRRFPRMSTGTHKKPTYKQLLHQIKSLKKNNVVLKKKVDDLEYENRELEDSVCIFHDDLLDSRQEIDSLEKLNLDLTDKNKLLKSNNLDLTDEIETLKYTIQIVSKDNVDLAKDNKQLTDDVTLLDKDNTSLTSAYNTLSESFGNFFNIVNSVQQNLEHDLYHPDSIL